MEWIDTPISEITTTNIIYFDAEHAETIKKVCNTLHIDCFPTLQERAYCKLSQDKWIKKKISYNANHIRRAFDEKLLAFFKKNDSNLIFMYNESYINGIVHFTNYEASTVYSRLYENLNIFEKNLRNHLFENGLDHNDFEAYIKYKLKKDPKSTYFKRRLEFIKNQNPKRPFENTYFKELINFSISSFHSKKKLASLGTLFFSEKVSPIKRTFQSHTGETINELRNFIMHHYNISDQNHFTPHNFKDFETFFNSVNVFHETFMKFREVRLKVENPKIQYTNKLRLGMLSQLNEEQITDYFYESM